MGDFRRVPRVRRGRVQEERCRKYKTKSLYSFQIFLHVFTGKDCGSRSLDMWSVLFWSLVFATLARFSDGLESRMKDEKLSSRDFTVKRARILTNSMNFIEDNITLSCNGSLFLVKLRDLHGDGRLLSVEIEFDLKDASHGGTEGQGQAHAVMAGSGQIQGQWYVDSDAKCGVLPSAHETSGRSSNELLVIPEIDKFRGLFASNKNATGGQMYQKDGEHMADVHEEESDSNHGVDEDHQEETRVGGGLADNCNVDDSNSHEEVHDEALAGGSGGSRMQGETCDGCVEGMESGSGSGSGQGADRNLESECEGVLINL
ncbi:hypothetical protein V6N12_074577 [Hibiscus sabdariffa]|uniref:Uncharacterized protein n=1 Tax=Hibiscus sabdariffa TaxID=183260 RepID=A0ABR2BXY0_9ROSI